MPCISRRSALRLGVTGLAGGLAGCLDSADETQPTRLISLRGANYDTDPHTLHVRLRDATLSDEESVVYSRSADLPAASAPDDAARVEFPDFPGDPGEYVFEAWRDDQQQSAVRRLDFREFDTACLGLIVDVGDAEIDQTEVTIWHTTNCRA